MPVGNVVGMAHTPTHRKAYAGATAVTHRGDVRHPIALGTRWMFDRFTNHNQPRGATMLSETQVLDAAYQWVLACNGEPTPESGAWAGYFVGLTTDTYALPPEGDRLYVFTMDLAGDHTCADLHVLVDEEGDEDGLTIKWAMFTVDDPQYIICNNKMLLPGEQAGDRALVGDCYA